MKRTYLAFGALLLVLLTMLVSLILLNQVSKPLSQLPEYQDVDPGNDVDDLTFQITIVQESIEYGIDSPGTFSSIDESLRLIEIEVSQTNLSVGDRIFPNDFLDVEESVCAGKNAVLFEIEVLEDSVNLILFNLENLCIVTEMTPQQFRSMDTDKPVELIFGNGTTTLSILRINFLESENIVRVFWIPENWEDIPVLCVEGLSLPVRIPFGQTFNSTALPSQYASFDGLEVSICRNGVYYTTVLSLGTVGFDFVEIMNENILPGDILVVSDIWN